MTRALSFLGGAVIATAGAVHHCNESSLDWSCYTVTNEPGEPNTVDGLAAKLHTSPAKLIDYNMLADDTTAPITVGTPLRVPHDACTPRDGNWACYTVVGWETVDAIANSPSSFIRNTTLLNEINKDVLYGGIGTYGNPLPRGLQLRLPKYPCFPTLDTLCYTVGGDQFAPIKDQTLADVAAIFGTNVSTLQDLNENTLGYSFYENSTAVLDGMQLTVPRPHLHAPSPCAKSLDWDCYTVKADDTLHKIGIALSKGPHYASPEPRANWKLLCEVNKLDDCDELEIGQVLAIPLRRSDSTTGFHSDCVDEPGAWYCRTVPEVPCFEADPGTCGASAYLVANALAPFGGENGALNVAQRLIQINQDLLVRNATMEDINEPIFMPGSTVRVPYNAFDCYPNSDRDCVAVGDPRRSRYMDEAYFAPMSLYYFGSNRDRAFGNCLSGQAVPADCKMYSVVEVPRQTLPIAACRDPGRVNSTEPPCSPTATGAAPYECPACTLKPGKHFCYKVVYGDTLETIGNHFGIGWQELCFFNEMTNCGCLFAEDTYLKIPVRGPPAAISA